MNDSVSNHMTLTRCYGTVSRTVVAAVFAITAGLSASCAAAVDPDDPFLSSTTSTPAE